MTNSDDTARKQARAIVALLTSKTLDDAAGAVGCSKRQLQRWMQQPVFAASLASAQDDMLAHAARRLTGMSASAVGVLDQVMSDEGAPYGVRARAADLTLANALRFQEAVHLARRVQALEQGKGKVQDAKETTDTD